MRSVLPVLLLLASPGVFSQPYETVIYGEDFASCADGIPEPLTFPKMEWLPDGTINYFPEGEELRAIAPAPASRVYAAVRQGLGFYVGEIDREGVRRTVTATIPNGYPLATVVDRAGAIYVTYDTAGGARVAAFDPDGSLRATYAVSATAFGFEARGTSIDLAADQCTLFWIGDGATIRRFDVGAGAALPDFATVPAASPTAIRVLPDGEVLVSAGLRLDRYGANGALVRSYPLPDGIMAMTLAREGTVVRYAETVCGPAGNLVTMNLESGVVETVADIREVNFPQSIVSFDGWTAAIGATHVAAIPTAGTTALLGIVILLTGVALLRLR